MPDPFLITISSAGEMLTFFDTDIKNIEITNRKTCKNYVHNKSTPKRGHNRQKFIHIEQIRGSPIMLVNRDSIRFTESIWSIINQETKNVTGPYFT